MKRKMVIMTDHKIIENKKQLELIMLYMDNNKNI